MRQPDRKFPKLGGTSIRSRMTLSMIYAAALVFPVVLLSLFYIRRIGFFVDEIAGRDIELMQVADRVYLDFLEARRHEKNFLLYGDSTYLTENRVAIERVEASCVQGREIDREQIPRFLAICENTASYRSIADSLFRLPPEERNRRIPTDFAPLRRHHDSLLQAAAAEEDSVRRDSLTGVASRLAAEAALFIPVGPGRPLNDSIVSLQAAVTTRSDSVIDVARRRIKEHRKSVSSLVIWSQRNTVTVLLVVLAILIWLIITLPRHTVLPIKRIANALRRAEDGNLDVRITPRSRDELGLLALQVNRAFARIREFDDRKIERILHLERRFRLLSNDITEGVLVVDRKPNVLFANSLVEPLLGSRSADAVGRPFRDFARLAFLTEPLERVLAGDTSRQSCEILPEKPDSAVCIEGLRDQSGSMTGALIVISNPPDAARTPGASPGNNGG